MNCLFNYVTLRYSRLKFPIVYMQATRKTHRTRRRYMLYLLYLQKRQATHSPVIIYLQFRLRLLLVWYIYTGKMAHAMDVSLSRCVLTHRGVIVS